MTDLVRNYLAQFLRRLARHSQLSEADQESVLTLPGSLGEARSRRDLVTPGQPSPHAILVGEGLLGRIEVQRDGRPQVFGLCFPGEMLGLQSIVAPSTPLGIQAIVASRYVRIKLADLRLIVRKSTDLAFAFWRDTSLDAANLSKTIVNVSRKKAESRIAHLLCEFAIRSEWNNQGNRQDCPFDLTQEQIGDLLGLTAVHVNRTICQLRDAGLATIRSKRLVITDWDTLADVADFTPEYLSVNRVC